MSLLSRHPRSAGLVVSDRDRATFVVGVAAWLGGLVKVCVATSSGGCVVGGPPERSELAGGASLG